MTKSSTQMYPHFFSKKILFESVKATLGKFGIEVWPGAGTINDRAEIVEFAGLELEDEGGFPVNSPDCQVNWINLFTIHGKT